jgi:endonuclease YncB( thermonuclease family)
MKNLLFLFLLFSTAIFAQPTPTKMYVTKVYDGDGCRAMDSTGKIHVLRFAGDDAPEFQNLYTTKTQPYAYAARDSVRALILHDTIFVDLHPFTKLRTSYGREVVDVYLRDGTLLNELIVARGWAWARPTAGRIDTTISDRMSDAYLTAQKEKVGLWGQKGYKILPGTWRFRYRRVAPQ